MYRHFQKDMRRFEEEMQRLAHLDAPRISWEDFHRFFLLTQKNGIAEEHRNSYVGCLNIALPNVMRQMLDEKLAQCTERGKAVAISKLKPVDKPKSVVDKPKSVDKPPAKDVGKVSKETSKLRIREDDGDTDDETLCERLKRQKPSYDLSDDESATKQFLESRKGTSVHAILRESATTSTVSVASSSSHNNDDSD